MVHTAKRSPENAGFWKNDGLPPHDSIESCIFQYFSSPAFFPSFIMSFFRSREIFYYFFGLPNTPDTDVKKEKIRSIARYFVKIVS